MTEPTSTGTFAALPTNGTTSYVDWSAIVAGILLASAISLVLLTFGSAIGLNYASFEAADDVAPIWVAVAAASWLLWVQVSSFSAGAYLAGRLRRRVNDATEHEVDVRDGAHGLLVWSGALMIGALIAAGGLSAIAGGAGSAATALAGSAAEEAGEALAPGAYLADRLFRPADLPAAAEAGTTSALSERTLLRDEAGRIVARLAAGGEFDDVDRSDLAQLVGRATGLAPDQAGARVEATLAAIDRARVEAARAAEAARRTGVVAAFLVAASLLVSAAGAFWAAQMGGNHRDGNIAFGDVFRRA